MPKPVDEGWNGTLHLVFDHRQTGTHLQHSRVQAPLKFQRPFYPEGADVCHGVVLHTAGGVVGGDRLAITVTVNSNAHALLTTAAAAKIYRSLGATSRHHVQISVAEGGCLEWLPQETILFNNARYHQTTRIDLAANAVWIGWDITRLGRSARGETFQSGDWRSHTEVWQNGMPVWIDPQWVQGGSEMLDSPHGLDGYPVIGSFALVGRSVTSEQVEHIRTLGKLCGDRADVGVTRLMNGLLCRYRGSSTAKARQWFIAAWDVMRQAYLNRPSCPPRAWLV
ncbi:MAG: urease accessory protein UreD [Elainellaceae cyanobacterium]